ncbi:prepilin-type N-terminal cleavage/methylation domain-containing protein [Blautia intestinalis]|uniref:prepilin-type N-terminal cleavage/methylation domain-containing protein n=1 Tax=Blautia intestinalis TaxID=2763028 RepID=UPI0022E75984|nr:prepilin-type N-terminal cleavage/methylation domain-containing protein [Blautia intestinalis]
MFKLLNKKKNNKGFTLVELVIAIAILAILVGLLAPQYTKYVEKSRKSADASNMDEMVKAIQVYAADGSNNIKVTTGDDISGTITIGEKNTTVDGAAKDAFTKALGEFVPDYANVKLKSKQWGTPNPTATVKVDKDGGVKVSYAPDAFADYMETNKTTAAGTGSN